MEIGTESVQKLYGDALRAARPEPTENQPGFGDQQGAGFTDKVAEVAQDAMDTLAHGEHMAKAAMAGKADPHSVVEALAQTEMALEMAVTVRDKVVEAYQEILRMPV